MGFFSKLKKMAKAVNEILRPRTIIDHVQERISELEKENGSGKRFVSVKRIWDWMTENESMRFYGSLNEGQQEELNETGGKKKAADSYDVQGREFPADGEEDSLEKDVQRKAEIMSKCFAESGKCIADAAEKMQKEALDILDVKDGKPSADVKDDVRYFGEDFLIRHFEQMPEVNSVAVVKREQDGVWLAATVEETDKENRKIRCGDVWHSEFLPYRFNEELVGTTLKPKNPRELRWGLRIWVKDDLKDEAEEAIFLGFNPEGESDLRWLTLSSSKMTLEAFASNKWPSFGHWKYMRVAED